ncbi:MAG: hypothetical protein ACPGJS_02450 [Flammeovirgaceae bacterium]
MRYLIFVILLGFFACKGTKESKANLSKESSKNTQTANKQVKSYQDIAAEKIGEGVRFEKNSSGTLVLCKKVTLSKNIPMGQAGNFNKQMSSGKVKLIVVHIEKGEVLYEKTIAHGSAVWANDTQLLISETMGAAVPNNPNVYLVHVKTGKTSAVDKNTNIEKP